jgi:tetratricopeptide (TPR) repeat protein
MHCSASLTINTLTPHEFLYKKDAFAVGEHFDRVEGPYRPFSVDKIQLNHYLLRSRDQFKKKLARGRSDHNRPYYQWEHFERINREATAIDHSILDVIQQVSNQHQRGASHTIPPLDDVLPPYLFTPPQIDFAQYSRIAFEAKNSGDLDTLSKVYREAVRKYPELLHSRLLLFDVSLQQAKITEAWQTIIAAAQYSEKGSSKILQREAKCLALMGQIEPAIAAYQRL